MPRGQPGQKLRWHNYLDAYLFASSYVDRRPSITQQTNIASSYAIQPGIALVHDRHGLHESEPVGPRRPRVRVHWIPHAAQAEGHRLILAGFGGSLRDGRVVARSVRLARCKQPKGR